MSVPDVRTYSWACQGLFLNPFAQTKVTWHGTPQGVHHRDLRNWLKNRKLPIFAQKWPQFDRSYQCAWYPHILVSASGCSWGPFVQTKCDLAWFDYYRPLPGYKSEKKWVSAPKTRYCRIFCTWKCAFWVHPTQNFFRRSNSLKCLQIFFGFLTQK